MTDAGPADSAPAEGAAAALARLYDFDLESDDPGDLDLYLALAGRVDGPIVELAAGTGRLAIPLATTGRHVTAVDLDAAMLERARRRAAGAGVADRVELVEADLLDLERRPLAVAGSAGLAILALNSLFLLPSAAAQATALRVMAGQLRSGGLAVVDVWLPTASDLAGYDDRLLLDSIREDPLTGRTVVKTWSASHDPVSQRVVLTTIYEEGVAGQPPVRWIRRDAMRLVGVDELRSYAASAGLVVDALAGGYDLEPIAAGADRAVLVARRP